MEKETHKSDLAIQVRGLVTAFGPNTIHDHLDLDVKKGEIIGLVGGSGTGKSVLLKAIIGLIKPVEGRIHVLGRELSEISDGEQKLFRRKWGVLFQDGALFSSLTVAENIQAPIRENFDFSQEILDEIAFLKLGFAGLQPEVAHKYPSELSGGMRKRAGLARALALDPELLFLDEPTAGLDPIGAASFDTLTKNLQNALGLTVFLVTHDLDTLNTICDRVAVLNKGKVVVSGALEEVKNFDNPWVQEYFNGPRGRAVQHKPYQTPAEI